MCGYTEVTIQCHIKIWKKGNRASGELMVGRMWWGGGEDGWEGVVGRMWRDGGEGDEHGTKPQLPVHVKI